MISHAITVISKAVEYLNPEQTVVVACDQPMFALAKTIQWGPKDSAGEDNLVVMLGGLHIEQAVLKAIGTWLPVAVDGLKFYHKLRSQQQEERSRLSTVHTLRARGTRTK